MDELQRAIKNGFNYWLDISDGASDHLDKQQLLTDNGYLLTGQYDYTMVYEKPNDHDTFNVKDRHRRYMELINPMLSDGE